MQLHRRALSALFGALAACGIVLAGAGIARAEEKEQALLDHERPVFCFTDSKGKPWRAQCIEATEDEPARCVVAINGELDEDGELVRPLERARSCELRAFDLSTEAAGRPIVRGLPDAPRGWMRDGRGRVFQVTFDLQRRLYAGVTWSPVLRRAGPGDRELGRAGFDFGLLEFEGNTGDLRTGTRHRLRLAEGRVDLAPFAADLRILHYDISRKRAYPLVRLTTFFGTPRRYDIDAHIGGWLELGHLQVDEVAPDRTEVLWRIATGHLTWDIWRTPRMDSFIRLRGGLGIERAREEDRDSRDATTWAGAVEGDLTLGDSGFDRIVLLGQLERPVYFSRPAGHPAAAKRVLTRVGYERIAIAVNDQPITLRVAAEAEYRDDIPDRDAGWDLRAVLGLRFNLWAPPR
jgi:hypothetical protein